MATKKPAPALAHYATKEPTPTILEFCAWIEKETGFKPDPLSVHLGSLLRGPWQKSPERQAAKSTPAPAPTKPRRRPVKDAA